jgi:hypothetical protein
MTINDLRLGCAYFPSRQVGNPAKGGGGVRGGQSSLEFGTEDKGRRVGEWRLGLPFSAFIFLISSFLTSCDLGEIPVPPHEPGEVQSVQVRMGEDYRNSIHFSIVTGQELRSHVKTTWDLGFAAQEGEYLIRLNGSKVMAAAATDALWLRDVSAATGADWKVDMPSGHPDSTAIGYWHDGRVRLIDLGFSISGQPLGFSKMRAEVAEGGYLVHFATLASADSSTILIPRDPTLNMICVSLDGSGSIVPIEPHRDDWELVFTQYTHIFNENGEVIPYLVTGVLTNSSKVSSVRLDDIDFTSIDLEMAESLAFSPAINIVGYNWKTYSFDTGSFLIHPDISYVLRLTDGSYYKLRFLDFYTHAGEKGAPLIEYQRL